MCKIYGGGGGDMACASLSPVPRAPHRGTPAHKQTNQCPQWRSLLADAAWHARTRTSRSPRPAEALAHVCRVCVRSIPSSDESGRGIWAWHTTPNVTSATAIAARLLQRTREASAAAMAKPGVCSEGRVRSLTSVSAYG